MRDLIQRHSVSISIISVIVIAFVLISKFVSRDGDALHNSDMISDECWYFDVNSGQYLRDKLSKVPPMISSNGGEIVRVVFFSCGGCNERERFPGFYLKYTPQLKAKADGDPKLAASLSGEAVEGRLFSFDAKTWITAPSAEAAGVFDHHRHRCDGIGTLKQCR